MVKLGERCILGSPALFESNQPGWRVGTGDPKHKNIETQGLSQRQIKTEQSRTEQNRTTIRDTSPCPAIISKQLPRFFIFRFLFVSITLTEFFRSHILCPSPSVAFSQYKLPAHSYSNTQGFQLKTLLKQYIKTHFQFINNESFPIF